MKTIFSLVLLITFCCITAESQVNPNTQDPAAEPYLNSLSGLFDPQKAFQIEFKYEIESKTENYKVNDFGSIIVKGQKYKLKTEDGETYYNGEKLWVYNKEAAEVYSSIPDKNHPEQMLIDPFRLLADYKDFYKYKTKGEISLQGRQYSIIELYPKDLNTSYSILRLTIEKKSSELYILELQEKKGITYRIIISEIIVPIKVNESAFTWNSSDHPGVLEVEM